MLLEELQITVINTEQHIKKNLKIKYNDTVNQLKNQMINESELFAESAQSHGIFLINQDGKEELLEDNVTLMNYKKRINEESVFLFKRKPKLVTIFYQKQFYVDEKAEISSLLQNIHSNPPYSENFSDKIDFFLSDQKSNQINLDQLVKLKKNDNFQNSSNNSYYFLIDNSEPSYISPPSIDLEFIKKPPKQKKMFFIIFLN